MLRVTCAVITFEGKVFAAQRHPAARHGLMWEFPGGKVEPDEGDQDCLKRELWEELAMQVEVIGRLQPVQHCYGDFEIQLIPFVCKPATVGYTLKEHTMAGWFTFEQLRELNWAEADRKILEQVLPSLL
jgi:8-oxo-dGTP diphosphatase